MQGEVETIKRKMGAKSKDLAARQTSVRENEKKLVTYETNVKQARENLKTAFRWQVPLRCDQALILAGDLLFAGGNGQVAAIEAASGKTVWTAQVEGVAKGLAVAGGRLLVSTDKGLIYAFGRAGSSTGGLVSEPVDESALANAPSALAASKAAGASSAPAEYDAVTVSCWAPRRGNWRWNWRSDPS